MREFKCGSLLPVMCAVMTVCLALTSCTSAPKHKPASDPSDEPYRLESEGTIPPLPESQVRKEVDRVETFEEMPVGDEGISVETVEPVTEPRARVTTQEGTPKTMDGYRVQVLASGNEASARTVKQTVETVLGVPAYVELIDGIYKVRVGDCPTREEAETLLRRCRDAGYGDAWIVGCPVILHKTKRTQ